jgi:hypothetical protein
VPTIIPPGWEAAILWKFHGTQAEAIPSKMCLVLSVNNVTIFLRKGVRHVLHYPRSALTRANGSRSGSRQWRRIRRSLIRIGLRS